MRSRRTRSLRRCAAHPLPSHRRGDRIEVPAAKEGALGTGTGYLGVDDVVLQKGRSIKGRDVVCEMDNVSKLLSGSEARTTEGGLQMQLMVASPLRHECASQRGLE